MRTITTLLSLMALFFGTNCLAGELKIFTWEDYISDTLIREFEDTYGHTVSQIYFENEMLRDVVVYSGKALAYDLFIIDGLTLRELGESGHLAKLSGVLDQESSNFTEVANQVCGPYGIPYSQGTMGIGYRTIKVDREINSWMDIFDYARDNPQTVVIPNDDIDTTAIALLALGFNPMTEDKKELEQAYNLIMKTHKDLLAFRTSIGYVLDKKMDSKMEMAILYSGEKEQVSLITNQEDWVYTIPNEGTLLWHECLSAHIEKPISKASIDFLNFINKPDNAVNNAEEMWFSSSNQYVLDSASEEYLHDEELFPENLDSDTSFSYKRLSTEAENFRSQIITVLQNSK